MLADDLITSSPNSDDRWMVGHLRVTTFIPDLPSKTAIENTWWKEMFSSLPEDVYINHTRGVKEEKGMFEGNLLVMTSQYDRVDWTFEATEEGSVNGTKIPALGTMSDNALEPFLGVVKKWLNICPSTNRLAFGAILGMPTMDIQTGYKEIQKYLPKVQLDPQTSSDFFYQINRPKKANVGKGIMINRLSKWTVALVGGMGVTVVDPTASKASVNIQGQHICRLELDINTVTLDDAVSGTDAYTLFHDLVGHGQEIASKGDI